MSNDLIMSTMIASFSLALALIAWKLLSLHGDVFGTDVRSRDRERQDYLRTITQLTEKVMALQTGRLTDIQDTTRRHLMERDRAASLAVEVEKSANAANNGDTDDRPLASTADPEANSMYR